MGIGQPDIAATTISAGMTVPVGQTSEAGPKGVSREHAYR